MPFVLDPGVGDPCAGGVESAERPRMIASSTSRFLVSIAFFRVDRVSFWVSSVVRAARLLSMIFSRPSIKARRALMLSETAPSAFARLLTRALRRAAWTGGVGVCLLGSVSFSYSESDVGTALVVVATALETAIWSETTGWISGGAEGPDELEKRDPPSSGFFFPALSRSVAGLATDVTIVYRRNVPLTRASIASCIDSSNICRCLHTSTTRRSFVCISGPADLNAMAEASAIMGENAMRKSSFFRTFDCCATSLAR